MKNYRARLKYRTDKEKQHITKIIRLMRELGAAKCLKLIEGKGEDSKIHAPLALDEDGRLLSIEDYCKRNNLDFRKVKNYRLIQHTGLPIYNISFHQSPIPEGLEIDDIIEAVRQEIKPAKIKRKKPKKGAVTDFLWFSDVHIGME